MSANPIDLIGGLATAANVIKADVSSWAKSRVPQVLASVTEIRNTVLASQLVITLKTTGAILFLDATDTTTADDGVNCIISSDGFRFKPKTALLPPTTVSLGGVFSSAAVTNQFLTGIDTAGNVIRRQPALADLTDSISGKDTDGTFAANSDTVIPTQKAVKTYVDTVAQGLDAKPSVLVATTANITLSGEQTIDGTLTSASRVLVKNQSTASQNGIYVSGAGSWVRAADADSWAELPGAYAFVEKGAVNGDTGWVCTVDAGGTIGSTSVTFVQFSSAGVPSAGTGLTQTGLVFSVTPNGITNSLIATMAAYTLKGNATGSSAAPTDIDITALTLKAAPVSADVVLIQDSAASFAMKKTTAGALATAGSVSDVNGQTGSVTILANGYVNKLRNSSLTSWFHGTSGTITTSGGWSAEGVYIVPTGASVTWVQGAQPTFNGGDYSLVVTGAASVTDVVARFVIESLDAAPLAGKQVTFQIPVFNNTGGTITPTITVKRANVADGTYTNIDVSAVSLQSIANGASGVLAYSWAANAGSYKGLSIDIDFGNNFSSGAKSIQIGAGFDCRVTPGVSTGTVSSPPAPEIPIIAVDTHWNRRFYRTSYENGTAPGTNTANGIFAGIASAANAASFGAVSIPFEGEMRATPSMSYWDRVGNASKFSAYNGTWNDNQGAVTSLAASTRGWLVYEAIANYLALHWAADATLTGA